MLIPLALKENSCDIVLERGCLAEAGRLLDLKRRVLIVTDTGVPAEYPRMLSAQCAESVTVTLPEGEDSKSTDHFLLLLRRMLSEGFTRGDCVAAVGGGMPGDVAGFASACYMRGIDFYNIPTTLLAQVDSSVGGKTAIDLDGIKNVIGAFHQPRRVLIDPDTLGTLPDRQWSNGLAEAVKMALCFDAEGFSLFERSDPRVHVTEIIERALRVKTRVVEQDEKDQGLRQTLNFGHTLGHGIESLHGENGLLHGECVALGMLPMCGEAVRERLRAVLEKLGLPTRGAAPASAVMRALLHDKKMKNGAVSAILCDEIGTCRVQTMRPEEIRARYLSTFPEALP